MSATTEAEKDRYIADLQRQLDDAQSDYASEQRQGERLAAERDAAIARAERAEALAQGLQIPGPLGQIWGSMEWEAYRRSEQNAREALDVADLVKRQHEKLKSVLAALAEYWDAYDNRDSGHQDDFSHAAWARFAAAGKALRALAQNGEPK